MFGGQILDQLANPGAQLVGEVRGRRADEGVDVVTTGLGHGRQPNGGQIGANLT